MNYIDVLQRNIESMDPQRNDQKLLIVSSALIPGEYPGFRITRYKPRGVRVAVKGPRFFSGVNDIAHCWPDDGLIETRARPKLAYILSGQAVLHGDGCVIECAEKTFVLYPPGVAHDDGSRPHLRGQPVSGEYCDIAWMEPWDWGIRCWFCHSRGNIHDNSHPHIYIEDASAYQLLNLIAEQAALNDASSRQVARSLLTALLQVLKRCFKAEKYLTLYPNLRGVIATSQTLAGREPIPLAQAYIWSHLGESLTIDGVARHVHMSRTQFTREFRRLTGRTFVQFVTDARIEKAKALLLESDYKVELIANHIGFKSCAHFVTVFRQRIGLTPGEFRVRGGATKK